MHVAAVRGSSTEEAKGRREEQKTHAHRNGLSALKRERKKFEREERTVANKTPPPSSKEERQSEHEKL
jgi:hypothetical protein